MSAARQIGRMDRSAGKRSFSSSDDEPETFKKVGTAAVYPAQQMNELQYQLGRAGSALKAANKVSMSIGWGPIIPQTPAAHLANKGEIPKPFSPTVGGVTPRHDNAAGENVVISRTEYERLLRNDGRRNREREGVREMRRNDGDRRNGGGENDRDEERKKEGHGGKQEWRRQDGPQRRYSGAGNGREKGYWGKETGYDEMRHLEGLCGRCGEDHATRDCSYEKEELVCDYKPCISKQGHTAKVCHEIMKRCRLPICDGQRGHRVKSHFRPDGVMPFGKDRRAAQELKRLFEDAAVHLTITEKRLIQRYESRPERLSGREGTTGEVNNVRRRGQNEEEEGIEMAVFNSSEIELMQ